MRWLLHYFVIFTALKVSVFLSFYGPYSVRMRETANQKTCKYGHFSRSDYKRNNPKSLPLIFIFLYYSLRENCPNTGFFLVRIFLYSVRIKKNTDQKKLRIWILFTQWFDSKVNANFYFCKKPLILVIWLIN